MTHAAHSEKILCRAEKPDVEEAIRHGAASHLAKPVVRSALLGEVAAIQRALTAKRFGSSPSYRGSLPATEGNRQWLSPYVAGELFLMLAEAAHSVLAGCKTLGREEEPATSGVLSKQYRVGSRVGFSSDTFEGTLVFLLPLGFLTASYRALLRQEPGEPQLLDWSKELANLLLGKLKARLLSRGITIMVSTPDADVVDGSVMQQPGPSNICWAHFGAQHCCFDISLDAIGHASQPLVLNSAACGQTLAEDDLVLF